MFNQAAAIGVDIGRNTIKIAVVKIHGEVIAAKSYPLDHPQSRDYIIAKLLQAIDRSGKLSPREVLILSALELPPKDLLIIIRG
jgi:predicted NBD/HSP70 family sugar kinase